MDDGQKAEPKPGVEERLAVLEEKLEKQNKSIFDRIKDWAGLAALLIAVAYTFPSGIWDKIMTTREKTLLSTREAIEAMSKECIEGPQAFKAAADPLMKDWIANTSTTKVKRIFDQNKENIKKLSKELSLADLLSANNACLYCNSCDECVAIAGLALEKAEAGNKLPEKIAALRGMGKAHFCKGDEINFKAGMGRYKEALGLLGMPSKENSYFYAMLLGELGLYEATAWNWECGVKKLQTALELCRKYEISAYDQGTMAGVLQNELERLSKIDLKAAKPCL